MMTATRMMQMCPPDVHPCLLPGIKDTQMLFDGVFNKITATKCLSSVQQGF